VKQNRRVKYLFGSRQILAEEQLDLYRQEGFLLVSGLIPPAVVECAHQAMLAHIGNAQPASRIEPIQHPSLLACFGRDVCSAAAQLAGSRRSLQPPSSIQAISVLPTASIWQWPSPHIDHAHEKDAFRTFPAPFRIGCLIYLNDVQEHAGGTIVWPGSHNQIEALAAAHPHRYEYLSSLNRDIPTLHLRSPVEITAVAGDVFFHHRLCAHSGSMNAGMEPRLALNHKW